MKILGIDPGSRITGYGIIVKDGNRLIHVDNGAIFTDCRKGFPPAFAEDLPGADRDHRTTTSPMPWPWKTSSSPPMSRAP